MPIPENVSTYARSVDRWYKEVHLNRNIRIVGAAFGDPKDEKTYSGVPKYLFKAIEKQADIVAYVNSRQLRPWDIFEGAIDFSKIRKYGRPKINVNWLWRRRTIDKLSTRFKRQLSKIGGFDVVLQMGTHVHVSLEGIRHYCRTDMTVLQGIKAKQFELDCIEKSRISEAVESQKMIFKSCDGIFVNSNWAKQSIVNDYGIEWSKVYVIGAGVSISLGLDIESKRQNNNILFIGRDWERKGGPLLIDAFKRIKEHIPKAKLTIIGCSPAISEPNVEVLGYLDKKNERQRHIMNDAIRDATILCVPSLFDPFGMCWLEAQFCGLVPVTFNGEGRSEAIKDGVTGVLVEKGSVEALSEAIMELLNNPDKTKTMSITGHRFVKDNFTWDQVAEKVLKVIKKDR